MNKNNCCKTFADPKNKGENQIEEAEMDYPI